MYLNIDALLAGMYAGIFSGIVITIGLAVIELFKQYRRNKTLQEFQRNMKEIINAAKPKPALAKVMPFKAPTTSTNVPPDQIQ